MARFAALDWDSREVRLVVASKQRHDLVVHQVLRAAIPAGDEAADGASPWATAAAELAAQVSLRRSGVLVAVPRSLVDLRWFLLPPAPDEELPEIVRNQVLREAGSLGDDAVIDFVALGDNPQETRPVVAAAIAPEQLAVTRAALSDAGITPLRLLVRTYAAAALVRERRRPSAETCLVVDATSEEADLTVMSRGHVVFSRTARLATPSEGEDSLAPLVAEVRRTIVAVSNQPEGGKVESLVVCGSPTEQQALAARLTDELSVAVAVFDPFDGFLLDAALRRHLPSERGRFAAPLGMLWCETQGVKHEINFLRPKRSKPPFNRQRWLLAGAGATVVLLLAAVFSFSWTTLASLDSQIEDLKTESRNLESAVRRAEEKQEAVALIGEWVDGDVLWLDELRDFSLRFPPRRDAVLSRLSLGRNPGIGGTLEFEGLVRDPTIVGRMESRLRDEHHEVRSKRVQENQAGNFTWRFESSVSLTGRSKEEYAAATAPLPIAAPGTAPPTAPPEVAAPPAAAALDSRAPER